MIEANLSNPNTTYGCSKNLDIAFNIFGMCNSSVGPFIFMIVFNLLTIEAIYDSRKNSEMKTTLRDIQFALVSVGYNVIFALLTLPMLLYVAITDPSIYFEDDVAFLIIVKLYQANFGMNFFISMTINRLFRQEFFTIIIFR